MKQVKYSVCFSIPVAHPLFLPAETFVEHVVNQRRGFIWPSKILSSKIKTARNPELRKTNKINNNAKQAPKYPKLRKIGGRKRGAGIL